MERAVARALDEATAGDTLPALEFNWGEGEVDITTWAITFRMKREDGTLLTKTAVITDGVAGDFETQWASGDLIAGKIQKSEIEFSTGVGVFTVRDDWRYRHPVALLDLVAMEAWDRARRARSRSRSDCRSARSRSC